ncbi:hypothetical protein ACFFV7_48900 [Nonomuraea spiralis]|uniref:Uncharacterized protein n=1 Tax=Nonomuraea spiralis TaxID=46182 RepID=A0ABV5IX79_9ACTN|nr:hypothetical protein [Nonomuraea spiralis]GGT22664.1 hypothetical protein GCM10010176_079110 [Nonomuraea spiralis]
MMINPSAQIQNALLLLEEPETSEHAVFSGNTGFPLATYNIAIPPRSR